MSEKYVKQHFVPRRYLDRFTFNKNGKPVIGVRMEQNGTVSLFTRPTKDVGYVKNIYDVTDKDDPKHWEHFFDKNFDTLCGRPLENIFSSITLSNFRYSLTEEDKDVLSKIIVSQMFREPGSIAFIKEFYNDVIKPFKKAFITRYPENVRKQAERIVNGIQISNQLKKEMFLNGIFNEERFDELCAYIKSNVWTILYNTISNDIPFVTSDNPILLVEPNNKRTGVFNVKLDSQTASLYFPLTPKIMIMNCNSDSPLFSPLKQESGCIRKLDEMKFICDINTKIIKQCYKHSFIPQPLFDELKEVSNS